MSRKTVKVITVKDGKITNEALGLIQRKAGEAVRRVEAGQPLDQILTGFQNVLEAHHIAVSQDKIWKKIQIGTHRNIKDLRAGLLEEDVRLTPFLNRDLDHIKLKKSRQETNLVILSGEELGFSGNTAFEDVYKAVGDRGLSLCLPEAALQLRLQYKNQPEGEELVIITKKVGRVPQLMFFVSFIDGQRWLNAVPVRPAMYLSANTRLILAS